MRLADAALRPLLLATVACAGVAPPTSPAPADVPFGAARPFAALYRLDCCGQRGLLLTARGDGERLALSVASGPAGAVLEAWIDAGGGVVRNGSERCVRHLSGVRLPNFGGGVVSVQPELVALLVRGAVAEHAEAAPASGGWLEGEVGGASVRWRVEGGLVVAVEVAGDDADAPALALTLADHHGRVPGRIDLRSAKERATLVMVEWREAAVAAAPAWVSWPLCGGGP